MLVATMVCIVCVSVCTHACVSVACGTVCGMFTIGNSSGSKAEHILLKWSHIHWISWCGTEYVYLKKHIFSNGKLNITCVHANSLIIGLDWAVIIQV